MRLSQVAAPEATLEPSTAYPIQELVMGDLDECVADVPPPCFQAVDCCLRPS